jgi:glycosyltransferase involved in cell wall biosynthesis
LPDASRKLRVGFPYVGDRFGGSNMSSLVMAGGLQQRGIEPVIMTHGPGRAAEEAAARGFAVHRLPPLSSAPGYSRRDAFRVEHLKAAPTCRRAIKELGLDLVHTNDLTMLRTWALPTKLAGARLIAHWRTSSRASLSVSAALMIAERIVSVSTYSKQILPDWAQRKTVVEFNALEVFWTEAQRAEARLAVRQRLGIPADAILIGVFGNLTRRKRAHALADVLDGLGPIVSGRAVFGIVCGGVVEPRDDLLEAKRVQLQLEERLLMPGFVRPVEEWMGACDVILAPAEREPLARNVLEAMAVGVPVIVSSDGGLREFVVSGENGFLLDPNDTPAWIEGTRRVLTQPDLAATLVAHGQASTTELTVPKHAERIERIYRAALRQ